MNVNWTPFRKLQARGMSLGPLVVDGDTVSVLELGEYFVFSAIDAAELTAWVGTLEEAMAIGEEWLMAKSQRMRGWQCTPSVHASGPGASGIRGSSRRKSRIPSSSSGWRRSAITSPV